MTPEAVAMFVLGALQPYAQEVLLRNNLTGTPAHLATIAFSGLLALLAVWVTGGLAGGHVPVFSLVDPSALLGFLIAKLAPVYLLSQTVFIAFNGSVRKLAGTAPTP